jgi:septal ring factor EnvC (AmiA/AmiB activator)
MKIVIDGIKKELQKTREALEFDKNDLQQTVDRCTELNNNIKFQTQKIEQIELAITILEGS